ncbi:MAG: hypothetical protein ACI8WB_004409 [Phenylobacterium sp.]
MQRTHLSHHNGVIFVLKQLHMPICAYFPCENALF